MTHESEISQVARFTRTFYDTYANLPTADVRVGELGYATDRFILYRWSGSAWQPVTARGVWSYLGEETPSGVVTSTITVDTHDLIKIIYNLDCEHTGADALRMRLNGITSLLYDYVDRAGTTLTSRLEQSSMLVAVFSARSVLSGEIVIQGKVHSPTYLKHFYLQGSPYIYTQGKGLQGYLKSNNADLSSVTLFTSSAAGTITGTIQAYSLDF